MVIDMNGTIRYTIRPYDTIWMLAQVFNTTVDDIMQLNPGIDPRNLLIGQVVNIRPGYQYYPSYNGNMNGTIEDIGADDMMNQDMEDLNNYFRMLWEQHYHWTTLAVLGIIQQLPQTDQIVQRLLRNPKDFANAFAPFYGEEAAAQLEELITAHLTIAAEVVRAAAAGDNNALSEADARWRKNADDIAVFLGDINNNWSQDDWEAMLNEHLDILSAFVEALIAGNNEEAIMQADNMEAQVLEMADMMAFGISEQFPG
jgi:hypothetical protein